MIRKRTGVARKAASCMLAFAFSLSMVPAAAFASVGDWFGEGNSGSEWDVASAADSTDEDSYIEVSVSGTLTTEHVMSVAFDWSDRSMACNIGHVTKTWDPSTMKWVYSHIETNTTTSTASTFWSDSEASATVRNRSSLPISVYATSTPAEGVSVTPQTWVENGDTVDKTALTQATAIQIADASNGLEQSDSIGFTVDSASAPTAVGTIRVPVTFYVNKQTAPVRTVTLAAAEGSGVSFTDANDASLASSVSVADGATLSFKLAGFASGYEADNVTVTIAGTIFSLAADASGVYTTPSITADAAVSVGVAEAEPEVASLSLDISAVTLTDEATTYQLATYTDTAGATPAITWTTSNPAVATVSTDGLVSAVGIGSCTITATVSEASPAAGISSDTEPVTASCTITVNTEPKCFTFGSHGSYSLYDLKNNVDNCAVTLGVDSSKLTKDADGNWIIGSGFLQENTELTALTIPANCARVEDSAFSSCIALASVTCEEGLTSIGEKAFYGCTSLTSAYLPDSLTTMGASIFNGCTSLNDVHLSSACSEIPVKAFYCCTSLESIVLPSNVTALRESAFGNCTSLSGTLRIPDTVTVIDNRAYAGCSSITSVILPTNDSYTCIEDYTFAYCSSLTYVYVPKNVTEENTEFVGCDALEAVYYDGTVAERRAKTGLMNVQSKRLSIDSELYTGGWLKKITLNAETKTIKVGDSIDAPVTPNISTSVIDWEYVSGDESCVSFSEDGYTITGVTPGTVVVRPKGYDGPNTIYAGEEGVTQGEADTLTITVGPNYTVTFDPNYEGATQATVKQDYVKDVPQRLSANAFTRTHYNFAGWNDKADGSGTQYDDEEFVTICKNTTLYAQWEAKKYPIKYSFPVSNGLYLDAETTTVWREGYEPPTYYTRAEGASVLLPTASDVEIEGYTVDVDESHRLGQSLPDGISADTKGVVVTIALDKNKATVIHDYQYDGKKVTSDSESAYPSDTTREGYDFAGWWTTKDDSGTQGLGWRTYSLGETVYLYAHWTPHVYSILYDTNGGNWMPGEPSVTSYEYLTGATLPGADSIWRAMYTFEGWYESPLFDGEPVTTISGNETEDKHYYAKWVPIGLS